MDKNINRIVKSELVARENNAQIRQEYGDRGHANISGPDSKVVMTTQYEIDTIIYVTIDGETKALGKDYRQLAGHKIEFLSPAPSPNPTYQIGYMFKKNASIILNKPTIKAFDIDSVSGGSTTLTFSFEILRNSGEDIFWSIIRDGDESKVIASGDSLDSLSNPPIRDYITTEEVASRPGDDITYTFIVTYNMPVDYTDVVNQKVIASTKYRLEAMDPITGIVTLTRAVTNVPGASEFEASYNLNIPSNYTLPFRWRFEEVKKDGSIYYVEGDEFTGPYSDSMLVNMVNSDSENYTLKYSLYIMESGNSTWRALSVKTHSVRVQPAEIFGKGGWMPAEDFFNFSSTGITTYTEYIAVNGVGELFDPAAVISADNIVNSDQLRFSIEAISPANGYFYFIEVPTEFSGNVQGDMRVGAVFGEVIPAGYTQFLSDDGKTVVYIITNGNTITSGSNTNIITYKFSKM